MEELLAERSVEVDHVTVYRWVHRFTPLLIDAARPCRHAVGARSFVDETYVKVAGSWRYVYRAIDEHGQVVDVMVSDRRDIASGRRFFGAVLGDHGTAVIRGHGFVQNVRRGHYELGVDALSGHLRAAAAFDELASVI